MTRPPIVRNEDPWSSHLAARLIDPSRNTSVARVLAVLREASPEWVPGERLREVGGAEGLRRARELRDRLPGYALESRPPPGRTGTWEYRLVPLATAPEQELTTPEQSRLF